MKYPVLIFYTITTLLLGLVIGLHDTIMLPYLEVLFVVFTFAESYFILQNFDFDHGLPLIATFVKLLNTITIMFAPVVAIVVHIIVNIYIYIHIRGLDRRHKRLKYHYTVNNVIPGPFLLKIFASFLNPLYFLILTILGTMRIGQKLRMVDRIDVLKYIVLADVVVLLLLFTRYNIIAFLIYMSMLIIFEFVPIEKQLES